MPDQAHTTAKTPLEILRGQLDAAAQEFSEDAGELAELLQAMAADVERASGEPLEILPVCHHSPTSAVHTVQRLERQQPAVIYMEMCEDLRPLVDDLVECKLPVALQAFASQTDAFPVDWLPLTVVAPLTEFSAECQAVAYALQNDVELVFVDRSVDHVFQQLPGEDALDEHVPNEDQLDDDDTSHGSALGVRIGAIEPTFDEFLHFLLRNARVRHWTEWWNQYVEQAIISADYETYRHVMFLMGSLMRRLGRHEPARESDRWRERYMWTRIKEHMRANDIAAEDAVYICGAAHAASSVEEFGVDSPALFDIPAPTDTDWQYGLIPSSFRAIERQFGQPPGAVYLSEHTWKKTRRALGLEPYRFGKSKRSVSTATEARRELDIDALRQLAADEMAGFLSRPPLLEQEDRDQLLQWCVDIVRLAQKHDYMASTADAIAIFEHASLLANMRNRPHPTPFDFRDAAVTCLEKTHVPQTHDIAHLCAKMMGGDRIGKIGYESMPPLARDVYDRLEKLPVDLSASTIQRALLDFGEHPEYLACSKLLWRLHYLLEGRDVLRSIMGQRTLGHTPKQESWDILIGKRQRAIIELGYEGVTVEQVVALRLKKKAFGPRADAVGALEATEDSLLYLDSPRLSRELGERAVELLTEEASAQNAAVIFERVRRLVHFYRSEASGLADWLEDLVATGYSHYSRLLPDAFADTDTSPDEIASALAFIFTLESLALSLGSDRTELQIAVAQAGGVDTTPDKLGLLWSAEWLLDERSTAEIRAFFDRVLGNALVVQKLPAYLTGFVLAMRFTKRVGRLVVELLSKAFARLPDDVLMPWLPSLIMMLEPMGDELVPTLIREAGLCFPRELDELDDWTPPWQAEAERGARERQTASVDLSDTERATAGLLSEHRQTTDALAALLGVDDQPWEAQPTAPRQQADAAALDPTERATRALLEAWPETALAVTELIASDGDW